MENVHRKGNFIVEPFQKKTKDAQDVTDRAKMGAFLDKPKTEKYNESRTGGGLRYGLSSMQVQ